MVLDASAGHFSITKQPGPLQLQAEREMQAYVAAGGLEAFRQVLAAHVACWHKTSDDLASAMEGHITKVLSDQPDKAAEFGQRLEGVRRLAEEMEVAYEGLFSTDPHLPIQSPEATVVKGVNFLSARKQEVVQLFRLTEVLQGRDREDAHEFLKMAAPPVVRVMTAMTAIENDLLPLAQQNPAVESIVVSKIRGCAAYHPTVARDWNVLAEAAERAGAGQEPSSPVAGSGVPAPLVPSPPPKV